MTTGKSKNTYWYTRRNGVVRGPYPEGQISRYILLGRIRSNDEVRADGGEWLLLSDCPEIIPDVMKLSPNEISREKLLMARMHEDERTPGDRRDRNPSPSKEVIERRSGEERRQSEEEALLRHRELRSQVIRTAKKNGNLYRYPLIFVALVLGGFFVSLIGNMLESEPETADCSALPQPGINWDHCNLSGLQAPKSKLIGARMSNIRLDAAQLQGANLSGVRLNYGSLNLADLQEADLSFSSLVGSVFRGANLRNVNLTGANMAYVNLAGATIEGADFTDAVLDHAIWIDQQQCAPGSIGECKTH